MLAKSDMPGASDERAREYRWQVARIEENGRIKREGDGTGIDREREAGESAQQLMIISLQ